MASREETFAAKILINDSEAANKLKKMEEQLAAVRKRSEEALRAGKLDVWKAANKEAEKLERGLNKQKMMVQGLDNALRNMSTASYKELDTLIKSINKELASGHIKRGSREWDELNASLRKARKELRLIKEEGAEQTTLWNRFFTFLNNSWGGLVILFQSITGLSQTIRKTVQDYADMEEAMADTRKYTGLSDEAIRDLNEDLKKMDTRTAREELNELAGAAGRLGKTAKKDILDFVEAGNMIKVALGDDLGEGAIDKVGKLAMAFGEDEKMGLRGAMLATGSAVNELAQNSSAQAGYLVDFTARVAGFGKQIGLTQAQIMGFAAVMDENLLRDEMAATAFGNMLTKMQTDTAKFARIAGQDVKEFTKLLTEDANAAILAVADSLKRQDPQTMMKMLDDMGLDGSRAVGVLSTLADKIDDVRDRQKLATRAYKEGTSVQKEYDTMNNTVQASIDKCKKRFQEMSVELGEKLLPLVKYTISSGSIMVKMLSMLANFVFKNGKELAILSGQVAILTAMWKAHTIWLTIVDTKNKAVAVSNAALTASMTLLRSAGVALHAVWALLTKGVQGYVVVMRAARLASLTNPWAALATVLTVVGVAIYGVVKAQGALKRAIQEQDPAWRAAKAHAKDMANINKEVNSSVAKEIATVNRLTNVIRSNAFSIDERRKAIKQLEDIVPGYHASITNEGKLIETTTGKLTAYIDKLKKAAKAQAYMDKLAEIENERLDNEMDLSGKQEELKTVNAEIDRGKRTGELKSKKVTRYTGGLGPGQSGTYREVETNEKLVIKLEERKRKEEAVNEALRKREELTIRQQKLEEQMKNDGITTDSPASTDTGKGNQPNNFNYVTEEEEKKKGKEAAKRLKEQAKAVKASYQQQLAEEMMAYRKGITTYTDYMEEKHNLTQNYYDEMKRVYGEDSVEYKQMLDNREKEEMQYYQWQAKLSNQQLTIEKLEREQGIKRQYMQQEVVDTEAMNEALFQSDITYLRQKQNLYKNGSKEWIDIEMQIQVQEKQHQFELEQTWMQKLSNYRKEAGKTNYEKLLKIELKGIETIYGALVNAGEMTKEEYDAIIQHIKKKFAELKGEMEANSDISKRASDALNTAKKNAGVKDTNAGDNAVTGLFSVFQAVENQRLVNEQLKLLYGEDYENNKEYQEAKRQLDIDTTDRILAAARAVYSSISSIISAASSYAQACSDLETAKITANYDKQIEAAGNNSKKREKLEKERDEKIRKMKTEANKKAMAMEIAQAVATTAMTALQAYLTGMRAGYPVGLVLGPLAAGLALAAGAVQIATIKKQHEAQAAGYYEGGFTGGRRYRREAGVVHEGEFVANHQAVQNPAIMPFLNFLDQAQRENRVASLKAEDVTNVMGGPAAQITPFINVQQPENEELLDMLDRVNNTQDRLATQLEQGIGVDIPIDGENGVYRQMKRYENLLKNK